MLSRIVLSFLVPLLLMACYPGGEYLVGSEGLTTEDVIASIQGREVIVSLHDSSTYNGEVIALRADTLALLAVVDVVSSPQDGIVEIIHRNEVKKIPLTNVVRLTFQRSTGPYAIGGAVLGIAGGAGVSYAVVPASGGPFHVIDPDKAAAVVVGGILGGILGGGIGALITPHVDYLFSDTTHALAETTKLILAR